MTNDEVIRAAIKNGAPGLSDLIVGAIVRSAMMKIHHHAGVELSEENDRLIADRDNSNRLLDECRLERNVLQKICAERSDEIERLRGALEVCAKACYQDDNALEYKPTREALIARKALG